MSIVSSLYKIARISNDFSKIASGSPKRIAKRAANKIIGRKIARRIFWK